MSTFAPYFRRCSFSVTLDKICDLFWNGNLAAIVMNGWRPKQRRCSVDFRFILT